MKKFARVMAVMMVVVIALAVLVSCGPNSNPDKAAAALKGKDYLVVHTKREDLGALMGKLDQKIVATKGSESITISWYQESADAQSAYDEAKKDLQSGWQVGIIGKMVWLGTNQAVKDAK